MINQRAAFVRAFLVAQIALIGVSAFAQAASRGKVVVFPMVFDQTGTSTARAKTESALNEILKKGGFEVLDSRKAANVWRKKGIRIPTSARPPVVTDLASVARSVGAKFIVTAHVTYHTRSIWVNLGPKTISTCHMAVTVVDSKTGKVVHEIEVDGRSDEKSDGLKVAAAVLISPLVTAVSGGPKTPQETRAGQIAAALALEDFVIVKDTANLYLGSWEWVRFDGSDDRITRVPQPSRYQLNLAGDGTVSGLADVNRFAGKYSVDGAMMKFGELAATKVAVPKGSLHDMYLDGLRNAASYVMRDGMLYIALRVDAGIMVFRRSG